MKSIIRTFLGISLFLSSICYGNTIDNATTDEAREETPSTLPKKPQLKLVDFDFPYEQYGWAEFRIIKESNTINSLIVTSYDEYGPFSSTSYPLGEIPDTFYYRIMTEYYPMENLATEYCVSSHNTIGYIRSDTIRLDDEIIEKLLTPSSIKIHSNEKIKISPNPVHDIFSIIGDTDNIKDVLILNQYGQTIKPIKHQTKFINIADLSSGIYFVKLIGIDDKDINTIKIIKY